MTRALADSLADALLRELPPERAYDRKALQEVALPGPVAHFLRHALDEQARREVVRLREARTGWIDYDAPDVREAFETLAQSAQNHARIPAGEWEAALHRATRETGAYLVRPRATLRRFVFAENDSVPARRVLQRMNFFSAYSYFGSVLRQYAEQREIERMNADRFAEMLRHIDQRMTSDHTPAEWSRMLKPLFAFAGRARRGPNDAAPAPLLRAFFEEKERDDLAARLPRGEEALTRKDLRGRLEADNEAPAAALPRLKLLPERRQRRGVVFVAAAGTVALGCAKRSGARGAGRARREESLVLSRQPVRRLARGLPRDASGASRRGELVGGAAGSGPRGVSQAPSRYLRRRRRVFHGCRTAAFSVIWCWSVEVFECSSIRVF